MPARLQCAHVQDAELVWGLRLAIFLADSNHFLAPRSEKWLGVRYWKHKDSQDHIAVSERDQLIGLLADIRGNVSLWNRVVDIQSWVYTTG